MEATWVQNQRQLYAAAFKGELERWLWVDQRQGDLIVAEVLRLLDEEYLVSLLLPKGLLGRNRLELAIIDSSFGITLPIFWVGWRGGTKASKGVSRR
jgi:hypothetical protein